MDFLIDVTIYLLHRLKFNVIVERYGDDNQLRWFLIKMTSIPKEREVNTPVFVEVVFTPKNYSNYHNCD